ncbi:uncharacterized protein LOC131638158 [Vicia villosa]|uniref:uncharacterized protein LOC131638158 n=1 Tax=Vicia villosa TaxID=3911 RepID=UPI00273B481F|nr:uncharacterized protein LOC131638158 [Vicia villosa]
MRSPSNVKEVLQLTVFLAALSRFLICACDKCFYYFTTLKKNDRFEWTVECGQEFSRLKAFLVLPPILTPPTTCSLLYLYLFLICQVLSLLLVQEIDKVDRLVYFIIKVFKGCRGPLSKDRKTHIYNSGNYKKSKD